MTSTLDPDRPCDHPDFVASVTVNRVAATEGGPIEAYSADIRVRCRACEHVVIFGSSGFTIRHPQRERIGDLIEHCELPAFCAGWDGPLVPPGAYRATRLRNGWNFAEHPDGQPEVPLDGQPAEPADPPDST